MEITREIGDRRGEGNALGNLGNAYADLGEVRLIDGTSSDLSNQMFHKAIAYHEQALAIDAARGLISAISVTRILR